MNLSCLFSLADWLIHLETGSECSLLARATGSGFIEEAGSSPEPTVGHLNGHHLFLHVHSYCFHLRLLSSFAHLYKMTHDVYLKSFCMVMRLTCISFCHSQCSPLADSFGRRLVGIIIETLLCWFMSCLVAWKTHTHISFCIRLLPGLEK